MRKIINIGTIVIGHSIATTLLSQHNPDIIVVDEATHFTEQLINHNLTVEDIQQFEQQEHNMKNLGMNALAAAMLSGDETIVNIQQKFANRNVIPHGKLRPINTHKRFNRYDGSNPAFKIQYNKSK